ncbi:hypothetical protein GSI_04983 [Ganoderma sinense ZZ0214-1]|uniref:Uncharacterized protein n=1 Tax=Ganoderma sinense ZZ0214-1 TaxID=1077348 RepID=A0A2G8SGF8_9APHY|nr:hypothetical protein GSI_04983 [Ganoderma sinense ZZ0214-1]
MLTMYSTVFSAFRVYAVSGRKVVPTLLVSLLSAAPIINSLIVNGGFTTVERLPNPFNCSDITRISPQWNFRPNFKKDRETLGAVLLRDGSLYFIVLALLNTLHIALTTVSLDVVDADASYVTLFIDPISSILTCRFILNLRKVDHSVMSSAPSWGGDVEFAARGSRSTLPRFVTSFGEPLHMAGGRPEVGNEAQDAEQDL